MKFIYSNPKFTENSKSTPVSYVATQTIRVNEVIPINWGA